MSETHFQTRDRTSLAFVIRQLRAAWRGAGFLLWWLLRLLPIAMAVGTLVFSRITRVARNPAAAPMMTR
jgi:hypothetical protein